MFSNFLSIAPHDGQGINGVTTVNVIVGDAAADLLANKEIPLVEK